MLLGASAAAAEVRTGTYRGNGVAGRTIAVGFQPAVVIVKGDDTDGVNDDLTSAVLRSATMVGDAAKPLKGDQALAANLIPSLLASGFTVGSDRKVNQAGIDYHWVAFEAGAELQTGTYVGNGSSQSVAGTGFSPDYVVLIASTGRRPIQRPSSAAFSYQFWAGGSHPDGVTSLDGDGFTVGASLFANETGTAYHYVAFDAVDGEIAVGAYVGSGTDNRAIVTPGFQPEYVLVRSASNTEDPVHRMRSHAGDASFNFRNNIQTNRLQRLQTTGFQVGTDARVNASGETYFYLAFATTGTGKDLAITETATTVRVDAPEYRAQFDATAGGGIRELYDLVEDPAASVDLAGGSTAGRLLHDDGIESGGVWYNLEFDTNAGLHLLEATAPRARVRQVARHLDPTGLVLVGPRTSVDHTLYPSNEIAYDWTRWIQTKANVPYTQNDRDLNLHVTAARPLDAWSTYSQSGPLGPGAGGADFLLARINRTSASGGAGARIDLLSILSQDWAQASTTDSFTIAGEWLNLVWHDGSGGTMTAGSRSRWSGLDYLTPRDLLDHQDPKVTERSAAYRAPAVPTVTVGGGWFHPTESTSSPSDFFNEREATYDFTFDPSNGLDVTFDATTPRFTPFFKLKNWRSFSKVPDVTLTGAELTWRGSEQTGAVSAVNDTTSDDETQRVLLRAPFVARSGSEVRIRMRAHSVAPLMASGFRIAETDPLDERDVVDATSTPITFGGSSSVLVNPGFSVWSDWVAFPVDETKSYSVTFYIDPVITGTVEWFGTSTQKYILFGDQAALLDWSASSPGASTRIDSLEEVEVRESVSLSSGKDYVAAVKPVTRSHFGDVTWHSTMDDAAAITSPDIGPPGSPVGVSPAAGRYGGGVDIDVDGEYVTLPASQVFNPSAGVAEMWYRPSYAFGTGVANDDDSLFGYWIDNQNYFYLFHEPYAGGPGTNDGLNFDVRAGTMLSDVTTGAGPSFPVYWRANEWVHVRVTWDIGAGLLQIFLNGKLTASGPYLAAPGLPPDDRLFVGERNRNGTLSNNARGTLDEVYFYDGALASPSLARGGLVAATDEYLASSTRNATLAFNGVDAFQSGAYWFVGADSQFGGLNVELATFASGVSPGAIEWEYWSNASGWKTLEVPGFFDETESFAKRGTVYWPDLPDWDPYALRGAPELYYVRAHLAAGETYTTVPVEELVQTDILLFQLCHTLVREEQSVRFGLPVPTAVTLVSFDAAAGDRHVALEWETGAEMQNLGFHLYRADAEDGPYERITETLIPGLGSSPAGARYRHLDVDVTNGREYFYLLEDIETSGRVERHGPVSATPDANGTPLTSAPDTATRIVFGNPEANRIVVHETGEPDQGVTVELMVEGFVAEPDGTGAVSILLPGLEMRERDVLTWVAATPGRRVVLRDARTSGIRALGLRPSGEPEPEVLALDDGTQRIRSRRARLPSGVSWEPARIEMVAFQGMTKKALLALVPLHWDASAGELYLAKRIVARLSFAEPDGSESVTPRGGKRLPRGNGGGSVRGALRLTTVERGLHAIGLEELGRRRTPSALGLSRLGEPVPFHLDDGRLFFWSDGPDANPYGDESVFELRVGEAGPRMETVAAPPSGSELDAYLERVVREERRLYSASLVDAPDPWVWDVLISPSRRGYLFRTDAVRQDLEAFMHVELRGGSDFPAHEDHHVRAYVNGVLVGETGWGGRLPASLRAVVPPGVLVDGDNTLELENVGDTAARYSLVYLERFVVDYPRRPRARDGRLEGEWKEGTAKASGIIGTGFVVDVTGTSPRWIERAVTLGSGELAFGVEDGSRYAVVAEQALLRPRVVAVRRATLRTRRPGADYIVVGPRALIEAAEPLLDLRRREGLTVATAPIEHIYDEFGFGEERPEAVHAFLAHAYHEWEPPTPRYVLLLGDATYDFKDDLGTGVDNQVPPMMIRTRSLWTASDPAYAAINGDDPLPDVAIGRLPASNEAELRVMVDKILAYEEAPYPLASRVALVADDTDAAGSFDTAMESLASSTLSGLDVQKIYLGELGAAPARSRVRAAFDDGVSFLSYAGHGGIHLWASENLLDVEGVDALAPQRVQPVVLSVNCLNGYFHFPYFPSLSEKLLEAEGKGAVAAVAPSGMSFDAPARKLQEAIVEALFAPGAKRLGDALVEAQAAYTASGALPELLSLYHLFGDPALNLR